MRWTPSRSDDPDFVRPRRPAQGRRVGPAIGKRESKTRPSQENAFYCVPLIDFGRAVIDFENYVFVVANRRYFLNQSKLCLLSLLLIAEGENVPVSVIARVLKWHEKKYPNDMVALLVRELRHKLRDGSGGIRILSNSGSYCLLFATGEADATGYPG
jgi:DNA-binding response OmpR family regulator